METYSEATICENGHVMSTHDANCQKYCSQCGSPTISTCPNCHEPIRGRLEIDGMSFGRYHKDMYCYNCGKPYPWTEKIINSAVEVLSMDEDLNSESRELLKNAIPNLIVETPMTQVAVARYKTYLNKAKDFVSNTLYQLLVDVICESAKKSLFPQDPQ